MADLRQRTLVSVRATCTNDSSTKVFARCSYAELGVPFSFDRAEPNLTGAENLLALLAPDVAGLFSKIAKQYPKHREMLDMEGLKKWEPGRTTGFKALAESLETLEV